MQTQDLRGAAPHARTRLRLDATGSRGRGLVEQELLLPLCQALSLRRGGVCSPHPVDAHRERPPSREPGLQAFGSPLFFLFISL